MNQETTKEAVKDAVLRELLSRPAPLRRTLTRDEWEQRQRRKAELEPILREMLRNGGGR